MYLRPATVLSLEGAMVIVQAAVTKAEAYLEAGSGPYLILLHAVGADASEWTKVIEPLAQHYHVIAPDQIGFGQSDKPYINYRMQTLADFLGGLYQQLRIERASIVGHSASGGADTQRMKNNPISLLLRC